ncbi:MAG: FG-GAP repeat protein [Planctomycetota bacterium]
MIRSLSGPSALTPAVALSAVALLATTLPTTNASASVPLSPYAKLTAFDRSADDDFGYSVAIDGGVALVGAINDDDFGSSSGAVYRFDAATGQQTAKITPGDGAAGDQFGFSVSADGGVAIVGARLDDDNGSSSGSAYLLGTASGQTTTKLTPINGPAGDQFGRSVAIDGDTAVVGAFLNDEITTNSGAAYVFDTATGQETARLMPADAAANDFFGISVAVDAGVALIGSYQDDDNGPSSGSAYLFDTATGQELAKLTAGDASTNDLFGYSVALDGGVALVGAVGDDDNGSNSGSAYLFDAASGQQLAKLLPDDGGGSHQFGWSVAIGEGVALVGAYRDDDNGIDSGSAYLFDVATGQQLAKLTADDAALFDEFGFSVALNGGVALVGAPGDNSDTGAAYLFDVSAFVIPEPTAAALALLAVAAIARRRVGV